MAFHHSFVLGPKIVRRRPSRLPKRGQDRPRTVASTKECSVLRRMDLAYRCGLLLYVVGAQVRTMPVVPSTD